MSAKYVSKCLSAQFFLSTCAICLKLQAFVHRNRSDFCDLRLRCPSRTPEIARFPRQEKAALHCDLRVRWKVASDLRFRAAISEPKTPSSAGFLAIWLRQRGAIMDFDFDPCLAVNPYVTYLSSSCGALTFNLLSDCSVISLYFILRCLVRFCF